MNDDQAFKNSQPLKVCDKCKKTAEPLGGVNIGKRWYCAKCWIVYLNLH